MKKCLSLLALVLSTTTATASDYSLKAVGFFAPEINGRTNVLNPEIGAILLDSTDGVFYGNINGNTSTGWIPLGGSGTVTPPGVISAFGGTSAPAGYLICDGSAVSRATYATLFSAIGTAYGAGDGSTTFNVPDFRGRFLRGVDGSAGNDPDASTRTAMNSGGNTGNNVGSLQADEFASHTHGGITVGGITTNPGTVNSTAQGAPSGTTSATGGNETRPKNGYVNFIIKY